MESNIPNYDQEIERRYHPENFEEEIEEPEEEEQEDEQN